MRLSTTFPALAPAALATLLALAIPAVVLMTMAGGSALSAPVVEPWGTLESPVALLLRTLTWCASIGALSAILGWAISPALRSPGRALLILAATVPLLGPAIVFFGWWSAFAPGNAIADLAAREGWTAELRHGVLLGSLILWAAPLSAWCVALWPRGSSNHSLEAARLDGAGRLAMLRLSLARDWPPLVAGAVATALVLWGDTSAFDLAQVRTIGFELRTLDALGMGAGALLALAWPALAPAIVATLLAVVLMWRLGQTLEEIEVAAAPQASAGGCTSRLLAWLVVAGSIAPLAVLLVRVLGDESSSYALHTRGAGGTVMVAVLSGALAVAVAVGQFTLAANQRSGVALLICALWLLWASVPATLAALGIVGSVGRLTEWLPGSLIVAIAELARFGVVAAMIGTVAGDRFAKGREGVGDLARLDARDITGWMQATWPSVRWVMASSFICVALLAAGEMAMAARVSPPGFELLAPSLLSALHYQEPAGVLATLPVLAGLAVMGVCAMRAVAMRRAWSVPLTGLVAAALLSGCSDSPVGEVPMPLTIENSFGSPGRVPGTFDYPRAIDFLDDGSLVVIDKSAQVQVFNSAGRLLRHWKMPESALGKPTGVTTAPNGEIWVADTHYHRVVRYHPDGNYLGEFGSYGEAPGQFIYPTDIAFGSDGRVYVAEYGGNDRIQVFDSSGALRGSFGRRGSQAGEFARPQSLAFSPDGRELAIADACNHRVVITDPEGVQRRTLGLPGRGRGELAYPYSVLWLDQRTLLVAEWGNNRLQLFDAMTGESVGLWGGGGTDKGRLIAPWAIAHRGDQMAVLDSGNSRVVLLDAAALSRK